MGHGRGLSKKERSEQAILDFGSDQVPVAEMRKARILAEKFGITCRAALKRVQRENSERIAKKNREHEKALKKAMKRPIKIVRPKASKTPRGGYSWIDNPPVGYVQVVQGGLPSLGKRRK